MTTTVVCCKENLENPQNKERVVKSATIDRSITARRRSRALPATAGRLTRVASMVAPKSDMMKETRANAIVGGLETWMRINLNSTWASRGHSTSKRFGGGHILYVPKFIHRAMQAPHLLLDLGLTDLTTLGYKDGAALTSSVARVGLDSGLPNIGLELCPPELGPQLLYWVKMVNDEIQKGDTTDEDKEKRKIKVAGRILLAMEPFYLRQTSKKTDKAFGAVTHRQASFAIDNLGYDNQAISSVHSDIDTIFPPNQRFIVVTKSEPGSGTG